MLVNLVIKVTFGEFDYFFTQVLEIKKLTTETAVVKAELSKVLLNFLIKFYFPIICHINVTKCILVQ